MKVFLLLALISISGLAAEQAQYPCLEDVKKFCADIKPGKGGYRDCLKKHENELSAPCKAKRAEKLSPEKERQLALTALELKAGLHDVCNADLAKHCKGKPPGEDVLGKCVEEHRASFSAGCKEVLK